MLKLTAELEMEEAGLQPFPEEEPNQEDPDEDNEKGELLKQEHTTLEDNHESRVPDSYPMLLSDQQSYQLYVQASKPAGPDLEDANVTPNDGADYADDNNTLYSQEIDIQHSRASDESLRRRRVSRQDIEAPLKIHVFGFPECNFVQNIENSHFAPRLISVLIIW